MIYYALGSASGIKSITDCIHCAISELVSDITQAQELINYYSTQKIFDHQMHQARSDEIENAFEKFRDRCIPVDTLNELFLNDWTLPEPVYRACDTVNFLEYFNFVIHQRYQLCGSDKSQWRIYEIEASQKAYPIHEHYCHVKQPCEIKCRTFDLAFVRDLQSRGFEINAPTNINERLPLNIAEILMKLAIVTNSREVIHYLIQEHNFCINSYFRSTITRYFGVYSESERWSDYYSYACKNNIDVAAYFLSINDKSYGKYLRYCIYQKRYDLLEALPDDFIRNIDSKQQTEILKMVLQLDDVDLVEKFLKYGFQLGSNAVNGSCIKSMNMVKYLVALDQDPKLIADNICWDGYVNNPELLDFTIETGFFEECLPINLVNTCIGNGNIELLRRLLSLFPNPNLYAVNFMRTIYQISNKSYEIYRILHEYGIDFNNPDFLNKVSIILRTSLANVNVDIDEWMHTFSFVAENSNLLEQPYCYYNIAFCSSRALKAIFEKYTHLDVNMEMTINQLVDHTYCHVKKYSRTGIVSLIEFMIFHTNEDTINEEVIDFMFARGAKVDDLNLKFTVDRELESLSEKQDYDQLMPKLDYLHKRLNLVFDHPSLPFLKQKFETSNTLIKL